MRERWVRRTLTNYRRIATLVSASRLAGRISRDADDDQVLACALAARADLIVSGDKDCSGQVFSDTLIGCLAAIFSS